MVEREVRQVLTMIEVVCAVMEDGNGRFLACQRPKDKHLGGLWEFPGGKIDPGESPQAALIREISEELAVGIEVDGSLRAVVCNYGLKQIRLHPFRCRIVRGEPHPVEHERILWCAPGDFDSLEWAEADVPILEEIRAAIAGGTW